MLHWIDGVIVLAYVAYSIWSGIGGSKAAGQNLEEYFLAGRTLKGWQAGVSMAATQFAADTPLVVTGLIATAGVFSLWRLWIYALAFLLMALVLGRSWRRAGVLTDAQLTEKRYGGPAAAWLRGAKAIYFGFVFNCTVLAMVLLATTRITEPFLVWDQWLPGGFHEWVIDTIASFGFPLTASGAPCPIDGVCAEEASCLRGRCIGHAEWVASANNFLSIGVIVLVTTLYSTTGGLRAVVKTDIAQFAIAMISTLIYAVVVVMAVGGFGAMIEGIHQIFPSDGSGPAGMTASEVLAITPDYAKDATWAVLGVIAIQWICQINSDGSGYLAQRTMACRSDRDARSAGAIFSVLQVLIRSLVWLPIGLGLLVLFPPNAELADGVLAARRESTFVTGIAEMLPPGIRGLMITGMLGALASTVDTHLNWGSSYFTNDIYKRFLCPWFLKREPSPKSLVWVARGTNLGILAIALVIMPRLDSIQEAWKASLLLGAGLGVPLVLRWFWWRMNAAGELTSLVASLVMVAFGMFDLLPVTGEAAQMLFTAAAVTSLSVVAVFLSPPEDESRLREFYEQAQPPGYWGPFAERPAANVRRLWSNLLAAAGSAFSIFCVLTAVASWMASSPIPLGLPSVIWIGGLLVLGVATVPVWLRMAQREPPEPRGALESRDANEP